MSAQVRRWSTGSLLDEARKGRPVPSSVVGTADHDRVVADLKAKVARLTDARAEVWKCAVALRKDVFEPDKVYILADRIIRALREEPR